MISFHFALPRFTHRARPVGTFGEGAAPSAPSAPPSASPSSPFAIASPLAAAGGGGPGQFGLPSS